MEGGADAVVTVETPEMAVAVPPIPEWQRTVLDRLRAAPNATIGEHATALRVSERWLAWLVGSDAFQSLLAREIPQTRDPLDAVTNGDPPPPAPKSDSSKPIGTPLARALRDIPPSELRGSNTANRLQRLSFTHDAMVDEIVAHPGITKSELSQLFGFPMKSINRILASDVFRARVAERKREIVDPSLILSVEETLTTLLNEAAEVVSDGLIAGDRKMAVRVLDTIGKYLGAGKAQTNVAVNNYVAVVPSKARDAQAWVEAHGPTPLAPPIGV